MKSSWFFEDINCKDEKERLVNRSDRRIYLASKEIEDRENEEVDRTTRLLKSNFDFDFFFCFFASAILLIAIVTSI